MGIKRRIIIPAIVALGTASSALAVSAVPLAAAQASNVPAVAAVSQMRPDFFYYG